MAVVGYGELYKWVKDDALKSESLINSWEAMDSFCRDHVVCSDGEEVVVCEPCVDREPVCLRSSSTEKFTFCYSTLISKIRVRWPLTECEKGVLQSLGVAPTQLHPNSWAFVRGFEILCSGLGIIPTSDKFFYFFESRVSKRTSWVSVSGVSGRGLLSLFQSSYKDFKKSYFRVRSLPGHEDVLEGFPLYWNQKTIAFGGLDPEKLSESDRVDVKKIEDLKTFFNTGKLLDLESRPQELKIHIAKMASMSNREMMKLWKQQQASKAAGKGESVTEKVMETDSPVGKSRTAGENPQKRRRETDKPVSVVNLETIVATETDKGDTEVQSTERTVSACLGENWEPVDHGAGRSPLPSFWDEKFNHSAHLRNTDWLEGDRGDLEKMSAFTIAKGVESLTNRLSALSLINEDKIRGLARETKLQGKKITSLEDDLNKSKAECKWVSTERDRLLEGRRAFEDEKQAWIAEKVALENELSEMRLARDKSVDAATVFENDLSLAKLEVERLENDLEASKVDSTKKFVQGSR
ncbi:uncharacterized protein LOC109803834 [Cajanus cajan]|uniref:uncharacterized protein LOC109803834 n=1 Tax=Cajanus cajan TaxID=3821 RepID=UPI00098DD29D|nr:uncharacterized protein LOC109803834 [Cajanus cajan]